MIETTHDDLRAALGVERWVSEVQAAGPFDDLEQLLETAHHAATPLSEAEVDEAVSHHPRIGEKPKGEGASQAFSRKEQSSADDSDEQLRVAIAAGNEAYEARFGRVFIIRAAGRSRAEIFTELTRRLDNRDEVELAIVGEQLRDIALLRLEALYGDKS
jgi:2-oxo-4-hydroxy-4-carboxy-5-ureidoimidazoline decarboxylase